jgi:hypothetical protein
MPKFIGAILPSAAAGFGLGALFYMVGAAVGTVVPGVSGPVGAVLGFASGTAFGLSVAYKEEPQATEKK